MSRAPKERHPRAGNPIPSSPAWRCLLGIWRPGHPGGRAPKRRSCSSATSRCARAGFPGVDGSVSDRDWSPRCPPQPQRPFAIAPRRGERRGRAPAHLILWSRSSPRGQSPGRCARRSRPACQCSGRPAVRAHREDGGAFGSRPRWARVGGELHLHEMRDGLSAITRQMAGSRGHAELEPAFTSSRSAWTGVRDLPARCLRARPRASPRMWPSSPDRSRRCATPWCAGWRRHGRGCEASGEQDISHAHNLVW